MAGRPKKPTNLKVLQGNPGKRSLPENEPKPQPIPPKCPSFLDAEAKREWRRMAGKLDKLGLLTEIDGSAFAAYCQAFSRWVAAEKAITAHIKANKGKLTCTYENKGGGVNEVAIPEIAIANKYLEKVKAFLTEFGMTPSSRSRLTVNTGENEMDPFEEFLRNGQQSAAG